MSSLQVANLLFESTGNNRIEYSGSNTFNMYAGNNVVFTANGTGIEFPNLDGLTLSTLSVGNSSVNTTANSTTLSVGSDVTVNTTAISVGNSSANVLMSGSQLSINGQNVSPVQSFRNKIINGNFDIWQRATTGTSGFVADRWNTYVGGSTAAISRQSFTLGQTDVPNEPTYFHRVVATSVAGAGNYVLQRHAVESVKTLAGQTATFSFWAKADASKNMAVELNQYFGSGGSPSSTLNALDVTTCSLTTSWQKFNITFNVPSISGKTLGSNNDDYLFLTFWFDAGSTYNSRTNSLGQQSGTFDIAQVQLEAGSVATPFEVRPLDVELTLCQRYYTSDINEYHMVAAPGATYGGFYTVKYPTQMRVTPSVSLSYFATNAVGAYQFYNTNSKGFRHFLSASTATNAYMYFNWTASAEL